jgi:succinate dehydrogenase/fumarate reductase-like Fe-S protein
MVQKQIIAKIARYSRQEKKKTIDAFEIPFSTGMTIQVLLRYIYENLDHTLAFKDYRCGRGVCNACRVKVNGKVIKSCQTLTEPGQEIFLEPANKKVIRDLVIRYD